jgi:4-hydroxy-2-oxoheptanedioate aldolase
MSADEAREIVNITRFRPLGKRALDGGNCDAKYCRVSRDNYTVASNRERFVIAQIEDPEAMSDLDAICQVDGIDIIFFGHGDYSDAIGVTGQLDHPDVQKARIAVAGTARKYGKFAGTVSSAANLAKTHSCCYDFICCGADVLGLNIYSDEIVKEFKAQVSN